MMDSLIYDPMKQISIDMACILKFINFLILRDFFGFFLNF